ncbi:zf-TFIIB domain-containing protein [Streptomyces sp. WAC04114]|uniref:TFIIB-type zinc ribbon-containing protein n=1 Tax=Streptomyces sp. WAC04114 TaxID=2867961 RepID=UPI001C8C703C|nr:zf-TFIIB domain-containing protein [Streptomyces sp. WAC04114]MBX9365684.1 zf-TFIIB domain-containing protein [Streptomyces sp. WAC04114]
MQCPKCRAPMHTYNRNGVQIEQCSGCRGIFLDYGELESLTRLEAQWSQAAPHGGHGHHGHHGHHRNKSFGHMLFSS